MGRFFLAAGIVATLLLAGPGTSATPGETFFVGFAEDLPKEIGSGAVAPAAELGATAFRLTTTWSPGQTAVAPAEAVKLDRATAAAAAVRQRLVLAVYGTSGATAPQDGAARDAYCSYVRSLLGRYSSIRDVVIWNEPNKSLFWSPQVAGDGAPVAAARYGELLARCYDVLHAAFPGVNVIGLALSSSGNDNAGSTSPGAFIRSLGAAYRSSGRRAPLLDTVSHHPYGSTSAERPWRRHIGSTTIAQGDWNKLMYNLFLAFDGTAQPIPGEGAVRLWYAEAGFQTTVDAAKAAAYTGAENVTTVPDYAGGEPPAPSPSESSAAPDQWTQALDAIRLAACQPYVSAYFNFLLADEPRLAGWQSGALWADLSRKDSWPAFQQAIAEASHGQVACDELKGGRPSSDFTPPSVPRDLTATGAADPLRVDLRWTAATDASALAYRVYRNGAHVATTAETAWTTSSVAPATTYSFAVRALDAAGNLGEATPAQSVATPAATEPAPPAPAPPSEGGGGESGSGGGGGGLPPDLSISLATAPALPLAGAPVDVVVTVSNDAAAGGSSGVVAVVTLPAGSALLGPPAFERGSGCTGTTTLSCSLDFLPEGLSTRVRFSFSSPAAGTLAATVAAAEREPDLTDNSASLEVRAAQAGVQGVATPLVAAPAAPGWLRARLRNGVVTLTWPRSADHAGVKAYLLFRDGVLRRSGRSVSFSERALRGRHVYSVRAIGAAGLRSAARRVAVRR